MNTMKGNFMKNFGYIVTALLITLLAGCGSAPHAPTPTVPPTPDGLERTGSLAIRDGEVMRLVAGTSGHGTLLFLGWEHPFTFTDAKLSVTGKEGVEIAGTVYNLKTVEDFNGTYTPVKADFKAGEGLRGAWGKNEKGVYIYIDTTDLEVEVNFQAKGATVTLD